MMVDRIEDESYRYIFAYVIAEVDAFFDKAVFRADVSIRRILIVNLLSVDQYFDLIIMTILVVFSLEPVIEYQFRRSRERQIYGRQDQRAVGPASCIVVPCRILTVPHCLRAAVTVTVLVVFCYTMPQSCCSPIRRSFKVLFKDGRLSIGILKVTSTCRSREDARHGS